MIISNPEYLAPQSLEKALDVLQELGARVCIIAGGTDLVPRMRSGTAKPGLLVDLRLLDLNYIESKGDLMCLGASITHTMIVESDLLSTHFCSLVEASKEIAGPPIRNRGTIGGNLVNASPAADLAPPLLIYDAYVVLAKANDERVVPLKTFFTGPGQTIMAFDEILTKVCIPKMPENTATKFIKLGKRKAMAISIVSVATRLTLSDDGSIAQARIALGSVAPTPIRALKAENTLEGGVPSLELFAEAGNVASKETSPISDIRASSEYRKKMVAVLTRRALESTWERLAETT